MMLQNQLLFLLRAESMFSLFRPLHGSLLRVSHLVQFMPMLTALAHSLRMEPAQWSSRGWR